MTSPPVVLAASGLALLAWIYLAVVKLVLGPMGSDEIYFSHLFWLLGQGKRQYVDFYSNHLPLYFTLLKPFLFGGQAPGDLSFVWTMRLLNAGVTALHVLLAILAVRAVRATLTLPTALAAAALALTFVVLGRMAEMRTDTFGLLLLNAAWLAILLRPERAGLLIGATLAAGSRPR